MQTSLKNYNSFGIAVTAENFISVSSIPELKQVLEENSGCDFLFLGGGSNILFTKNPDQLVVHLNIKGIATEKETENHIWIRAMAGENWHNFVMYCIENNYGGIENLSLIPGNVGTAPIQNIGAYGVELKDVFESCRTLEVKTLTEKEFDRTACRFEYRNSIFKNKFKNDYVITSVLFKLTKKKHVLRMQYGDIQKVLQENQIESPTIKDISEAVIAIRKSKLPDPEKLGNAGSFFKNPVIDATQFSEFKKQFPKSPFYEIPPSHFKIPAAWLIETCGFKGRRFGDAGVHKNQALVLVNYGNATGEEIYRLALKIQEEVRKKTGIYLEPEVNII